MTTLQASNKDLMSLVRAKLLSLKDYRIRELENELSLSHTKVEVLKGKVNILSAQVSTNFNPQLVSQNQHSDSAITLQDAVEMFLQTPEVERRKDKMATVRKNSDCLKLLMEIVGASLPLKDLNQSSAVKFANTIRTYKTLKPRSENTINGYLSSVSKFSTWVTTYLSETGHVKINTEGLRHRRTIKPSEERADFQINQIKTLFNHIELITIKKDVAIYWLVLIAAFSGMRLEEIAQLDPQSDIREEDGVWIFDINQRGEKSLKNPQSARRIPIHSALITKGLLEYVESLKAANAKVMFPNETIRDGRIGKNLGKRANRIIKNVLGEVEGTGKSLHCFRHTVATALKRKEVPESFAAAILGHHHGDISYSRYGKDYHPSSLKECIEMIQY